MIYKCAPPLLSLAFLFTVLVGAARAQDDTGPIRAVVDVESAFVRVAPSLDAEPAASVYQDNILELVSRNLDGTWFEVRRPGRLTSLGWIFNKVLDGDFQPELLPLGDLVTGATGSIRLAERPAYGIWLIQGAALRESPGLRGRRILNIPPNVVLPVLERNQDGSWLRVHYLGNEGWVSGYNARRQPYIMDIPQATNLPALEGAAVVIIPVEIQLAQVERLRAFINDRRGFAKDLENFWWGVFRGEIMPCNAPSDLATYPYGEQDVRELPELQRYAPRVATAIDYINTAIEPLKQCGVIDPTTVIRSRDAAINAGVIFDATLDLLDALEVNVIRDRR